MLSVNYAPHTRSPCPSLASIPTPAKVSSPQKFQARVRKEEHRDSILRISVDNPVGGRLPDGIGPHLHHFAKVDDDQRKRSQFMPGAKGYLAG